jgi:hypothetical protein
VLTAAALCGSALLAAGCGAVQKADPAHPAQAAASSKPVCAHPAGWQRLANRVKTPVYCPSWLPGPLTDQIGGQWNNINVVSPDRSYLESFVWQDTDVGDGGEFHVNLRAYPGRTTIPTCRTGGSNSQNVPCFAQPGRTYTDGGITARLYTVNQDADTWHALLLWRRYGNLYTLSQHIAPPLTYRQTLGDLQHELGSLVLIEPTT